MRESGEEGHLLDEDVDHHLQKAVRVRVLHGLERVERVALPVVVPVDRAQRLEGQVVHRVMERVESQVVQDDARQHLAAQPPKARRLEQQGGLGVQQMNYRRTRGRMGRG
jgi:hypothetical protein